MKIFIPIVKGIYRHQVLGAFDSFLQSEKIANKFFSKEPDDWHDVEIVECEINKAGELGCTQINSTNNKRKNLK